MKQQLCREIETAVGRPMRTPKDYTFLSGCIYARLHILVSSTTLKRIWGYLDEGVESRPSTLGVLARFLGYRDWDDYCDRAAEAAERQSSPVMSRRLSVGEELKPGDRLRLTWQPERVCDVVYLGNLTFQVTASENTRLLEGDTFGCSLFVEGEPLYLDNLQQEGRPPVAYVCGKRSGIRFEIL